MKQYAPFCQIIFLSSYLSYATEVYETEHIYFILKSICSVSYTSVA